MKADHKTLVKAAVDWLRRSARCGVILWEATTTGGGEEPDAIGWRVNGLVSHLVEVKISRSDFLADRNKPFRQYPGLGVGLYRWMLVPDGLVDPAEVPSGWGLIYHVGFSGRARVAIKAAEQAERNRNHELALLYNGLRRHRANVDAINGFVSSLWPLRGEMPEVDDCDRETIETESEPPNSVLDRVPPPAGSGTKPPIADGKEPQP